MDKTIVYTGDGFVNGLHSFGTILKHEPWKKSMELKEVNTIITGGDSFTDMAGSWREQLSNRNYDVLSAAIGSAGNNMISRATIKVTSKLLDEGKKPYVMACWSSLNRYSFMVEPQVQFGMSSYKILSGGNPFSLLHEHMPAPGGVVNFKDYPFVWLQSPGGHALEGGIVEDKRLQKFWVDFYKNYYNDELEILENLEHFLKLQWFCKSHDLDYKFFFGWKHLDKSMVDNLSDNTRHLWNLIDWDKWWFCDDNYGGINEWTEQIGMTDEERFCSPGDNHPSLKAHTRFTNEVISKWIS